MDVIPMSAEGAISSLILVVLWLIFVLCYYIRRKRARNADTLYASSRVIMTPVRPPPQVVVTQPTPVHYMSPGSSPHPPIITYVASSGSSAPYQPPPPPYSY